MNLLLVALVFLQDAGPERLIEALHSDSAEERESADRRLRKLGAEALPYLRKATSDKDDEVARRCRSIVEMLTAEIAKEAYAHIEGTLRKASTVRIRFKNSFHSWRYVDGATEESKCTSSGVFLAKEGKKAYLMTESPNTQGRVARFLFISDGQLMTHSSNPGGDWPKKKTPGYFDDDIRILLLRLCPPEAPEEIYQSEESPTVTPKTFQVSDFREAQEEAGLKSISFRLSGSRRLADEIRIRYWYVPGTFHLAKKETRVKRDENLSQSTFIEVYDEFTLNADIPDEKFKLPEERK